MLAYLYVMAATKVDSYRAVTAEDPYATRCDLANMLNPIVGFFVGEAKGIIPQAIYVIVVAAAIAFIFLWSKKIQNATLRKVLIAIAAVFALGGAYDFARSVSAVQCVPGSTTPVPAPSGKA